MSWFWQKTKEESARREQQAATQEKRGLLGKAARTAAPKAEAGTASAKKAGAKPAAKPTSESTANVDRTLLGPVVTEKAARLAESGTYVFAVTRHANKLDIAAAVAQLYNVHPIKVTVSNSQRKPKMFAQRYGRRAMTRKAYVSLTAGESIELFKS